MSRTFQALNFLSFLALLLAGCAPALGGSPTELAAEVTNTPTPTAIVEEPATPTSPPVPTDTARPTPDLGGIDPSQIVTLLPPDAIPAIWDPEPLWSTVEEAERSGDIADEVGVIGVAMGGEARAYPIPFLSAHEIVNDTVGGKAIAVTW
jgi:hypothetical protein